MLAETKVAVEVVIVNDNQEVLLLKRSASDQRRPLQWDLPGGHVDPGELSETAAIREVKEETSLDIDVRALDLLCTRTAMVEPDVNVNWLFYKASVKPDQQVVISSEHDSFQWVGLDQAIEMVQYDVQNSTLRYIFNNRLI